MTDRGLGFATVFNAPIIRSGSEGTDWNMIDGQKALTRDRKAPRIRIGAVSYLNSKPLIEGLEPLLADRGGADGFEAELLLDYPSRLADQLAKGQLDVALIPSVEALSDADYRIVSDACVATHGPVMSVKLFCRKHPGRVRSVALDEGSRTSAALVRIMLEERYGVRPELLSLPLGKGVEDTAADAVLLIGDRAMHKPDGPFATVWDLGSEWLSWTGLPFVFAMWVARRDLDLGPVERLLAEARDLGCRRLGEIARREASKLGLSEAVARRYLEEHLHFQLGSAERTGLRMFHELARKLGLVPDHSAGLLDVLRGSPKQRAVAHRP